MQKHKRKLTEGFYVLAVCSNPQRWASRFYLFQQFRLHMRHHGAEVITIELAHGDRPFQLTERDDEWDLQYRTDTELWHKENLINLGIQYLSQLDPDWRYVAWIDGDIKFQRPDFIEETAQQLQHFDFVQMFSHCVDMGPNGEFSQNHNGFVWSYQQNGWQPPKNAGYGGGYGAPKGAFWHPGYAWAATREAIDSVGGLIDGAILGSGDHHMAMSLVGRAENSLPAGVSPQYRDMILRWQALAEHNIRHNVGYVPGMITHSWHGPKVKRRYVERWDTIIKYQFDPVNDLRKDRQGLYMLNDVGNPRYIGLRDSIRRYFRERDEDDNTFTNTNI